MRSLVELRRCGLQHFEREHLGLLQRAAIVAIGLEDRVLAVDLVLGVLRDVEIDRADLVEAVGDVAARDLHPDVGRALEHVELAVGDLVDHALGVVADRVEALGDRLVALADLHAGDLVAHDSLNTDAWPSVRAITWILSGSRSEICSSRALIGAGSTLAGIRPRSRNAPTALSRYCIGVRTATSFMAFSPLC